MIRVLAVDHTAGIRTYRKKFEALAAQPGIQLTVLAPERWVENYREVRADPGIDAGYAFRTARVGWPGYENRAFFRGGLGPALRASRPDILHLWEEPFSVLALQALGSASIWTPRARCLFFSSDNLGRGFRYPYRPGAFYAAAERYAYRRCVAGTAVNSEVVEVLRSKGYTGPVEIVPHGLDLAAYGRRASSEEVRARFGLEPPIVGFAGRLLQQKGVDLLLRAVARVPRVSLVVIGEGPEREALEAMARDLGLMDRARFFPLAPHEAMPDLLAAMDVLVLPSRTTPKLKEQFGRVLIEGMAAGCVTIGSTSGAIPEVLGDGGITFEEENVEALIRALNRALDPEVAGALRERGRRRAESNYAWEAIARRIAAFYRALP